MADKSLLNTIGDKAKRFASDAKSLLPENSETSSMDAKYRQIDEYAGEHHPGAAPVSADSTTYPQDRASGSRSLADRGLRMIDTGEMRKALGSIPSYDEGTKRVPEDQLALIHEGEAVVPADENPYNTDQPLVAENTLPANPSKEMQAARKKVANPGAPENTTPQPTMQQIQPEEETPHPAITAAKNDAVASGDFVKAGKLSLLNKIDVPKEFQRVAPHAPAIDLSGNTAPEAQPAPLVHTPTFQEQLAQLQQEHATALKDYTSAGQYKADRIQERIEDLKQRNPWGSKDNHPGFLGKLGHIASKVGNIAGDIIAPQTMALIPGTDLNKQIQKQSLLGQIKEDEEAIAKENKATSDAWRPVAGAVGPNGRVPLLNSKTNEVKEAPEGFTPYDKPQHEGSQGEYIQQWYKDHPEAPKSTANDDIAIEAYATAKLRASQENKAKGKMYYYNTPQGRVGYTYAEAKAAGLNPGEDGVAVSSQEAEKDRKANDTYESLKSIMQQYQGHLAQSEGQLLPTDVDNMSSMIESVEAPDYISKIVTGIVDDLYGKPVTGYNEKLMKGALTKKAYDAMSPAARQLVADYFTTLMAHFGNVKATLGQVPRNEKLITTEMNMIPKPYLNGKEAEPAFNNYTAQVERNNAHNVKFGKQESTTNAAPAPEGTTHEVVKDGKVIGHVVTGPDGKKKYQPLQ